MTDEWPKIEVTIPPHWLENIDKLAAHYECTREKIVRDILTMYASDGREAEERLKTMLEYAGVTLRTSERRNAMPNYVTAQPGFELLVVLFDDTPTTSEVLRRVQREPIVAWDITDGVAYPICHYPDHAYVWSEWAILRPDGTVHDFYDGQGKGQHFKDIEEWAEAVASRRRRTEEENRARFDQNGRLKKPEPVVA
jgi:hypothetical protein